MLSIASYTKAFFLRWHSCDFLQQRASARLLIQFKPRLSINHMALTAKERKAKQRALDKKEGFIEISFRVRVERVPVIREFVKELIKDD